ncbi:MAG TPA: dephospho-CoA kinase [Thermoleophilaceae bacterium]|nr:dephospho-CoA kinase [Thermoleophilaceae bacterium]
MPSAGQVPFVGLTGGIGSGKSTALDALEELGAATLSADVVVHELLGSDEVRDALATRLGADVLDGDGAVDRRAVAARIFDRSDDRAWLEGMLWPRVGARIAEWRAGIDEREPRPSAAVVEVPLLFEAGMDAVFDTTIAVVAQEPLRRGRAEARGHAAVAERSARQLSQQEKATRAGHVVRNDGTREELKAELSRVLATITD